MENTMTKLRESRVLRCIMAAIVAIGVCTPFLSANPDKAEAAGTIEAVDGSKVTPENGVIISLNAPKTATIHASSPGMTSTPNTDGDGGWDLAFPTLTNIGAQGWVEMKYPQAGRMLANGQWIYVDALAHYDIAYYPGVTMWNPPNYPTIRMYPALCDGVGFGQSKTCHANIKFYNHNTGERVIPDGGLYYTLGSLNGDSSYSSLGYLSHESVILPDAAFSKVEYVQGGNIAIEDLGGSHRLYGNTDNPNPPGWSFTYDQPGREYYNWNAVTVYPTNSDEIDVTVSAPAQNDPGHTNTMWWTISSAPLAVAIPPAATKTVDKENAENNDVLNYSIEQQVGVLSETMSMRYTSLAIVDSLPENFDYQAESGKLVQMVNGAEKDVTATAGSFAYDTNANTLTYNFSKEFLSNMPCVGETYKMTFSGTVDETTAGLNTVENSVSTFVNGSKVEGGTAKTLINNAVLSIDKNVSDYEWQVGDEVDYSVVVNNTQVNTVADNVVVSDISLPEGLRMTGNATVEGLPATVQYPKMINGEIESEDCTNESSIKATGTGFTASMKYLPANTPVTIKFKCVATEDVNGAEVINTASATADNFLKPDGNKDTVTDTAKVWVNTAKLNIEKTAVESDYSIGNTVTYKIKVTNEQAGTIAHNIVVDDKFEQDGMQLIRNSFTVADSDGNIITDDCKITQNLNNQNFSIATYKDLVSEAGNYQIIDNGTTTDGGKWNPLGTTKETALYIEYQAVVTDPAIAGTTITNTATASSDNSNIPEDDAVISIPDTEIPPNPPIRGSQVTTYKSSDPAPNTKVKNGDEITYTLTSKNTGFITAPYTLVRDYIPEGTTYVDGSVSKGGAYVTADAEGNTTKKAYVEWLLTDIAVDASVNTSFKVTVNDDSPDVIENAALTSSVDRPLVPGDPSNPEPKDPSNRIEHPKTDNPTDPCIEIIKSSDPIYGTEVSNGDTVNYTLTVKNSGGSDAKDVAVYDAIPTGTDFKSVEKEYGATVAADSASLGWNIPELKAGESVDLHFAVTVNEKAAQAGIIQNQASYDMNTPGIPTTPLTNTSNIVEHPVKPGPSTNLPPKYGHEVTVYKSSVPTPASLVATGDEITYTLNAVNTGAIAAPFTVIRDYIPEGTTYVDGSVSEGGIFVAEKAYVEWVLTDIAPNAEKAVSYKVTVADNPPTWVRNTALYGDTTENPGKPGEITTDPKNETNEILHTTDKDVPVPAVLDMVKDSEPVAGTTVMNGEEITYKLTLKNNGGTAAENAGIRDYIPEGTTYVEGSITEGGHYNAAKNCVEWTIDSLEADKDTTVSFKVIVNDGFTGTKIANQALFGNNWNGETDPGNSTNIVEHPFTPNPNNSSSHSGSSSYFDKTGEWIADHLLLLVGLALIAFAAGGAGFKLVRKKNGIV